MQGMFTHRIGFVVLLFSMVMMASSSCDLINPEEQVPAFIRIDSIQLATSNGEGTSIENFVDAWVFENEKLLGIYELPATVPVLKEGLADIRIRAGVKLNGQVSTRIPWLFCRDYQNQVELFSDSITHINPTLTYSNWVTFDWLEDFDGAGNSVTLSNNSPGNIERVTGSEAFDGKSLKISIDAEESIVECRRGGDPLQLPSQGTPVMLEMTYRCNNQFVVGLYSSDLGGTVQQSIIVFNPKEEWNHVYINLTDAIGSNANYFQHQPFIGFMRDEDVEGEAYVYLDNIRLLH
jgi:hypothetical protein